VVLVKCKKTSKWIKPGGWMDGVKDRMSDSSFLRSEFVAKDGRSRADHDPFAAANREVLEETGGALKPTREETGLSVGRLVKFRNRLHSRDEYHFTLISFLDEDIARKAVQIFRDNPHYVAEDDSFKETSRMGIIPFSQLICSTSNPEDELAMDYDGVAWWMGIVFGVPNNDDGSVVHLGLDGLPGYKRWTEEMREKYPSVYQLYFETRGRCGNDDRTVDQRTWEATREGFILALEEDQARQLSYTATPNNDTDHFVRTSSGNDACYTVEPLLSKSFC
jgi:8-oxo-dGTP pyrophosphatase MutT (NUDIX family)